MKRSPSKGRRTACLGPKQPCTISMRSKPRTAATCRTLPRTSNLPRALDLHDKVFSSRVAVDAQKIKRIRKRLGTLDKVPFPSGLIKRVRVCSPGTIIPTTITTSGLCHAIHLARGFQVVFIAVSGFPDGIQSGFFDNRKMQWVPICQSPGDLV